MAIDSLLRGFNGSLAMLDSPPPPPPPPPPLDATEPSSVSISAAAITQSADAESSESSANSYSSSNKPNLNISIDSPGSSWAAGATGAGARTEARHASPAGGGGSAGSSAGPHPSTQQPHYSWQQPYSELSRFPSASHRFRGSKERGERRDWPPEGASKYMTPLPSPLESRSRSISDAASESSVLSVDSGLANVSATTSTASGRTPGRTKTMQFFESMDSAFSPPPPPRLPSFSYHDEARRELFSSTSSLPGNLPSLGTSADSAESAQSNSSSVTVTGVVSPAMQISKSAQTPLPAGRGAMEAGRSQTPSAASSMPANLQPLSNLPSGFRSTEAPSQNGQSRHSTSPHSSVSAGPSAFHHHHSHFTAAGYSHSRNRSGSHGPSVLGRQVVVNESPLASPTDSQSSGWIKEPVARLPTLFSEPSAPIHAPIPTSSPSSSSSHRLSASLVKAGTISRHTGTPSPPSSSTSSPPPPALHPSSPPSVSASTATMPSQEADAGHVLHARYEVIRVLGLGAFSKVVLARRLKRPSSGTDGAEPLIDPLPLSPKVLQQQQLGHKRSSSLGRGLSGIGGLSALSQTGLSLEKDQQQGSTRAAGQEEQELVALKLISRTHIKKNDRMRISIVREVEVLKHIRHPSLVHLTSSFDTAFHTCLVLEYSPGGELFDFLANYHDQTSEALVRRIFGELADVLGWMHSIGLVHRDIKLENILLTTRPFASVSSLTSPRVPPPAPSSLPPIPTPLVKLTDFGLSRFIDPSSPYLETRCGSEEYAAPELIMGKRYDGRQTDAWALGVVLYALITGFLPFVEDGFGSAAGGSANGSAPSSGISPSARGSARSRRNYLLKIAKGEYRWPEAGASAPGSSDDATRMMSDQVRDLVAGLLCRDPKKRIKVEDCWDYSWMDGPGAPDKRSIKGGGLEGVSVSAFGREDEAMVRSEVPEGDGDGDAE